MTAHTHVLVGIALSSSIAVLTGQGDPWAAKTLAAVALGSLAPDIDHPRSWLGRRLPIISWPLAGIIGHRGLSHSLIAAFAASIGVTALLESVQSFWLAFLIGYLSHLLADWNTNSGIPLFWPAQRRFRAPWAFPTGSIVEWGLGLILAALVGYQGYSAFKGVSLWG